MLYKSNIFAFFLLAAVTTGLVACTADIAAGSGETGADEETVSGVRYLSLRVGTSDSDNLNAIERAAESGSDSEFAYEYGTEFEHAVDFTGESENVLIFLNKKWQYKGYSTLTFDRNSSQGYDGNYPAEAAYIGFLRPSDFSEVNNLPEYGMVVLNASNISEVLGELVKDVSTIDDVLKLVDRPRPEDMRRAGRRGNYFTMTSTAYLVKETNTWRHSVVFEIDKSKVFDNRSQAVISPAATAVVERMSAKFSLSMPGATGGKGVNFRPNAGQVIVCNYIDGQPSYDNRTWTCSVAAWGINKYEPGSYYFRNIIGKTAHTEQYPYTYDEDINTTDKPFFNGWNNAAHHRTFWAVDPNYEPDGGHYPTQFRAAVDNPQVKHYNYEGRQPSLAYVSYNELSTDLKALDTENGSATLYSPENTFPDNPDNDRLSGHWQHDLAGSEVVIGARIHVNGVDETREDYDLYRNRIGVFYPSTTDFATYFISTINTQLSSQSNMTYRYYNWENPSANSNETVMRNFSVDKSGYKLYYQGKPLTAEVMASLSKQTIPATIENGDGKVIPWVEDMRIGRRDINPDTYEEVGGVQYLSIESNEFKSLIYDWIGPFDHFNEGRMVYSIPIRYRASKEKISANNYKPTVGDFGVVRNSWYRIVIDGINNLGTPVDNPDQKIIPYEASLENSILMEINVLKWHGFATDVTLPDHLK